MWPRDAIWLILAGAACLSALLLALPLYLVRLRARTRVDITSEGVAVRGVLIPAAAIRAIGLTGPIHDPALTLWHGAAEEHLLPVSEVGDHQIALTRRCVESLWPGLWHRACGEPQRLLAASELSVDLAGRYLSGEDVLGGAVETGHSMTLRDGGAEAVLMLDRFTRRLRTGVRVHAPDGRTLGTISEIEWGKWLPAAGYRRPLLVYDADGRLLARTEESRRANAYTILDTAERPIGRLSVPHDNDSPSWITGQTRSPEWLARARYDGLHLRIDDSVTGLLRLLLLAVPLALRLIDIKPGLNGSAVRRLEPISPATGPGGGRVRPDG